MLAGPALPRPSSGCAHARETPITVRDIDLARALHPILDGMPQAVAEQLHALPDGAHCATLSGGERICLFSRHEDAKALLAYTRLALNKRHSRAGYQDFALPPALDANLLNL